MGNENKELGKVEVGGGDSSEAGSVTNLFLDSHTMTYCNHHF